MSKAEEDTILVFTEDTVDKILLAGGSGDWVINPKRAGRAKYLVCCRKESWANRKEGFEHRAAFLIGKIESLRQIEESDNPRGQLRFLIAISQVGRIDLKGVWDQEHRNPVAYESLSALRIDLRKVKFEPIPAPTALNANRALTIAEAKEGLAKTFGIKPEDVEIIIRG
jgi:hypothetical protein